jgi:exodeoxyribonuclease VII large subunit
MAAEIAVPAREEVLARVTVLETSALTRLRARIALSSRRVAELSRSYALGRVRGRLEGAMQRLDHACLRLLRAGTLSVRERSARVDAHAARLAALDPREVLRRGYAACLDARTGRGVSGVNEAVRTGAIHIVFHDGTARATVHGAAD